MARDPAFLFYPNDYIGGTMGMTLEEKGAYIELLMLQFNRGHMTNDMIGQVIGQLWDNVQVKFVQDNKGLWFNERLELEKDRRKIFVNSRRNNLLGINQYTKKTGHMTNHMENENVNESKDKSNKEINVPFSEFWELYDKKIGKKEKIEKKWNKLNFETQTKIMNHIPEYKIANPDKIFRKNPETYLNNDAWLDELPIKQETDEKKIKLICPEHENQTMLVKVTIPMLVVFCPECRLIMITESEFALRKIIA